MFRGRKDVRKQPLAFRPVSDLMTVVWEVGREQADSGSRPSVLVIGVQSSPNYRLQQSVHE